MKSMQPMLLEIACIYSQTDHQVVILEPLLPWRKILRMRLTALVLLFTSSIAAAQNLRSGGTLKPEQAIMDVRHYTINVIVDPAQQSISGFTIIKMKLTAPAQSIVLDFWHGLTTTATTVNKKPATFDHSDKDILTI